MNDSQNFRELAGVKAARWLIAGVLLIGPLDMLAKWLSGEKVEMSEVWMSSVITMAGGAFGFLSGKQSSGATVPNSVNIPVPEGSIATTSSTTEVKPKEI